MTHFSTLCQGRIVWAPIADPNGRNCYHRPLVILTPNEEIPLASEVFGVVASNTAALRDPPLPNCVALPFHPTGAVKTKLRKPTVAVCEWVACVRVVDITPEDVGGIVPPTVLEKILEVIRALSD